MLAKRRIAVTAVVITAVTAHLPTAAVITSVSVFLVSELSKVAQELAATFVALFAEDPKRADRALRVIRALRLQPAGRRGRRKLG
jgi:uncharacterized membrane protein YozB (DUF420 family)